MKKMSEKADKKENIESLESGPASELSTDSVISERDEVKQAEERLRQKSAHKNNKK